ncbi:MAG: hypothetical protein HYS12_05365 [Planctomycetes bacterium]|nr:hypothetical protein [Planctomycetota bacterium]
MRVQRVRLLLVPLLLWAVPGAQGQSPTNTLKQTKQADWHKEVRAALTTPKGKTSRPYQEASKYIDLAIGPQENPSLRYDPDTFVLTWRCKKRASAAGVSDTVIKDAVIDFLKYAGGSNFNRALYEQADVQPGTGKLRFNIVLTPEPPPPAAGDIGARLARIEELLRQLDPKVSAELREELKKVEEMRRDPRRIEEVRTYLRRLSDRVEELLRKQSSGSGSPGGTWTVSPGAVFFYHPGHWWAWHCYPTTGYFFTPAYYVVRPQATGSSLRTQLNGIREELARGQRMLNANGVTEASFVARRQTVTMKPLDLTGRKPEDAEEFYRKGYALYWDGRVDEALAQFRAAVTLRDEDARFWAYRALAEKALGDLDAARASARKAARYQKEGLPGGEAFGLALERVQGAERRFLNAVQE